MSTDQIPDYPEPRDEDGRTPAAWVTTWIITFAFVVGTVGVCMAKPWLFWVGVGIIVLGLIVGKAMQSMGYGQYPPAKEASAERELTEKADAGTA